MGLVGHGEDFGFYLKEVGTVEGSEHSRDVVRLRCSRVPSDGCEGNRLWDTKLGAGERWGIQRTGNYRPDALLAALRIQKGKKKKGQHSDAMFKSYF